MTFRRSKSTAVEKQRWKSFITQHGQALSNIGMPEQVYQDRSSFDHWLMHGQHPLDVSGFAVEQMNAGEREILVSVISSYLNAGFRDPGIAILSDDERRRISTMSE